MPESPRHRARLLAPLAVALLFSGACDDDLFLQRWEVAEDTVSIYSLARPELNLATAFNFNTRFLIEVEQATSSGSWDLALDTRDGELVFVTPRQLGIDVDAGITPVDGASFEALALAPADTALYYNTEPIPVEIGQLYAIRTLQSRDQFGRNCNFFGKLQPLSMDAEVGVVEFRYDASPVCNNRELIPPN